MIWFITEKYSKNDFVLIRQIYHKNSVSLIKLNVITSDSVNNHDNIKFKLKNIFLNKKCEMNRNIERLHTIVLQFISLMSIEHVDNCMTERTWKNVVFDSINWLTTSLKFWIYWLQPQIIDKIKQLSMKLLAVLK